MQHSTHMHMRKSIAGVLRCLSAAALAPPAHRCVTSDVHAIPLALTRCPTRHARAFAQCLTSMRARSRKATPPVMETPATRCLRGGSLCLAGAGQNPTPAIRADAVTVDPPSSLDLLLVVLVAWQARAARAAHAAEYDREEDADAKHGGADGNADDDAGVPLAALALVVAAADLARVGDPGPKAPILPALLVLLVERAAAPVPALVQRADQALILGRAIGAIRAGIAQAVDGTLCGCVVANAVIRVDARVGARGELATARALLLEEHVLLERLELVGHAVLDQRADLLRQQEG